MVYKREYGRGCVLGVVGGRIVRGKVREVERGKV